MIRRPIQALIVAAAILAWPGLAQADCTGPAGVGGQIIWNTTYSVMQYCNGTNWINMGGVASNVAAAGSTGYIQFNTSNALDAESALVWDKTNNRLGIGSTSPATALDVSGTVTATLFAGSGASLTALNASNLASGTVGTARLGSGTADTTTFLRGDSAWTAITGLSDGDKGSITVSSSGTVWTIDAGAVTNAMLAGSIAYSKLSLTGAILNADLAGSIALSKLATSGTASSSTYLRGDGAWTAITGLSDGDKGSITVSSSGTVWTIDASAVTNAMLAGSIAASKLIGTDIATVGTVTSGSWNAGAVTSSGALTGTTVVYGNGSARTETRDNAGLQGDAGAKSGFFETSSPSNYPEGASSWWHMLDVRHSNSSNNYALQIAGSFFDQDLYFRKTNNSASTAWSKVLVTNGDGSGLTNLNANNIASGTVATGRLGSGTASSSTYLRGDGAWSTISALSGGSAGYGAVWSSATALTYDSALYVDTANHRVGIGTTTPGVALDVIGAMRSSTGLTVSSGRTDVGSASSNYAAASGDWNFNLLINSQDTSSIGFHDGNHSVGMIKYLGSLFTIGGDAGWGAANVYMPGSVGIGTATPGYKLDVTGDIRAQNAWLRTTGATGWYSDTYGGGWYMTDSTWIRAYNSKPVYMSAGFDTGAASGVNCGGGMGNGYTLRVCGSFQVSGGDAYSNNYYHNSDLRLKTDIHKVEGLELINKIQGVRFKWKKDGTLSAGVIAQDVEKVLPEAVTETKDGMKAVSYDALIAPLIEAVKELKALFDAHGYRIARLEAAAAKLQVDNDNLSAANNDLRARVELLERARGKSR